MIINSVIYDENGSLMIDRDYDLSVSIIQNNIVSELINNSSKKLTSYTTSIGSLITLRISNLTQPMSWKLFHFVNDIGKVYVSCNLGTFECGVISYSESDNEGVIEFKTLGDITQ